MLPSVSSTAESESIHSLVSVASISSLFFDKLYFSVAIFIGVSIIFSFFSIALSASLIKFSVSLGIFSFLVPISSESFFCSAFISKIKSPFETLSPTFTFIFETTPSISDGTSTLDLSLSKVTTGSFFFIFSPTFTITSTISTCSKSPMSGTFNWIAIINLILTHFNLFLDNLRC